MSEPADKQEAARIRRRWLTLGELLAIAAVAISGLTLWNSWRERTDTAAEKQAADARQSTAAATLLLKAAPDRDGGVLTLSPRDMSQAIQGQTIRFPAALGLAPVTTTGDARIERDWLSEELIDARRDAGMPAETKGDAAVPLLLTTRFLTEGRGHETTALYELGYATERSLLSGTRVRLRGLSLVGRTGEAAGMKRMDAIWSRRTGRR